MKAIRPAATFPDVMPVLSSGKHRSPRKGACFMEMASYLAGERWSDHPACTHPLLASMARLVNDSLPDAERPRILPLIPEVVGLTGTALELDVAIAVRAAAAALPVAPAPRQNALAVGLLTCRRLACELPDRPGWPDGTDGAVGRPGRHEDLVALCDSALDATPDAHAWALRFGKDGQVSERTFRRQTAPHLVAYAVEGIAVACVDDVAARLVALLASVIHDTARRADHLCGQGTTPTPTPSPSPSPVPAPPRPAPFDRVRALVR